VKDAGWLTWEEYCYLVVAPSWWEEDCLMVYDWQEDPKQLAKEFRHLQSFMRYPEVKPYVPVFKKVMKRLLWETEMRKIYPEAMGRRFGEFEKSGLTLNFTERDLERDQKTCLDAIPKVGKGPKSAATEKVVETESILPEAPRSTTLTSDDTSNTALLEKANGDRSVTK
jgi:hypothetical protein